MYLANPDLCNECRTVRREKGLGFKLESNNKWSLPSHAERLQQKPPRPHGGGKESYSSIVIRRSNTQYLRNNETTPGMSHRPRQPPPPALRLANLRLTPFSHPTGIGESVGHPLHQKARCSLLETMQTMIRRIREGFTRPHLPPNARGGLRCGYYVRPVALC